MVFELEIFIVRLLAVKDGAADHAEGGNSLEKFYSHHQTVPDGGRSGRFRREQRGQPVTELLFVLHGRQQTQGLVFL